MPPKEDCQFWYLSSQCGAGGPHTQALAHRQLHVHIRQEPGHRDTSSPFMGSGQQAPQPFSVLLRAGTQRAAPLEQSLGCAPGLWALLWAGPAARGPA